MIARYHLRALSAEESTRYIQHRLGVAGASAVSPFDDAALALVHETARGVPRRLNLLCDRALLGAYAKGKPRVDTGIVERAALEVFGKPAPSVARRRERHQRQQMVSLVVAGVLLGLALATVAVWWVTREAPVEPVAAPGRPPTSAQP